MVSKSAFYTNFWDEEMESGHQFITDVELESNIMTKNMLLVLNYISTKDKQRFGRHLTW